MRAMRARIRLARAEPKIGGDTPTRREAVRLLEREQVAQRDQRPDARHLPAAAERWERATPRLTDGLQDPWAPRTIARPNLLTF